MFPSEAEESPFMRALRSLQEPPAPVESAFARMLESLQEPVLPPTFTLAPLTLESSLARALESLREPPTLLESPIMRALESLQETKPAIESAFARMLESLQEATQPLAFTLPPLSLESPAIRALESLQEPTFSLEPPGLAKGLASMFDAIQPPAPTLPLMPTFSDDRELSTISRLVMPSEFKQPSTRIRRSLNLEAYSEISEFENDWRRFIDGEMTKTFGSNWPKRQIPANMRKEWEERRECALKAGQRPCPLIDYARKLPRQGDSFQGELPAVIRARYVAGGTRANASWGRSSLYSHIHCALSSRTCSSDSNT